MAVGLGPLPDFHPIEGIRIGVASAGIKKPGRKDTVVFELAEGCTTAATFTRNQFCAAPVTLARAHLSQQVPRYLVINTGNANAGTGRAGLEAATRTCSALAALGAVATETVLPFSTGVIGELLPVDKLEKALPAAVDDLRADGWADAASGIMTTDTLPKGATCRIEIDGHPVHSSGVSKGAGMIRPNMATMLAFVATDARIEKTLLQTILGEVVESSFNRITVDGDTSTNDACVLTATGRSAAPAITADSPHLGAFREGLRQLFVTLAQAIIRDGEGATKFVTVRVEQAATQKEALDVAYTVAQSPLVKTALYASDPNWGRILAAVGRAGVEDLVIEGISIYLGDVCIVRDGARADDYTEERGQGVMDCPEIEIRIELGRGEVSETVWTSDFSHDYVTINAEYRT